MTWCHIAYYYLLVAAFARAGIAVHLEERIDPVKADCHECVLRLILLQSIGASLLWPIVLGYLGSKKLARWGERKAETILDHLLFPGVARRRFK